MTVRLGVYRCLSHFTYRTWSATFNQSNPFCSDPKDWIFQKAGVGPLFPLFCKAIGDGRALFRWKLYACDNLFAEALHSWTRVSGARLGKSGGTKWVAEVAEVAPRCSPFQIVDRPKCSSFWDTGVIVDQQRYPTHRPSCITHSTRSDTKAHKKISDSTLYTLQRLPSQRGSEREELESQRSALSLGCI